MNINTRTYWDARFSSGDWEKKQGRLQTRLFAEAQVKRLLLPSTFAGVLLDFGCGLGDAMPVYRQAFPSAKLVGVDLSPAGIDKCREQYGQFASFIAGDHLSVPQVNAIISSNVFEHLADHEKVAEHLSHRCQDLFIIVPYRECLGVGQEHINTYDETSFPLLKKQRVCVFSSAGWSQYGKVLWWDIYTKNTIKWLLGRPTVRRKMQILFHIAGSPTA